MSAGTIARTIVLMVALVNQFLAMRGIAIIPIDDAEINEFVSLVFTIGASVVAWYKNNSFSKEAIEADEFMHELKAKRNEK